ncbi:MAG: protein kinase [Gemmatimonadales bacterium]|jgi:serine/threonine-protein kinase
MYCSRCGTEVDNQSKFCPSCGLDLATTTPLAAIKGEQPPTGESSEASEIDAVRKELQDEWDVEKELGRGGMAIVYKARDKQLDRDVAIKILPFSLAFDKEFVERFQREARTAGKLEHPHIIPIYRVGKSGRVIYFVMKFLRGSSLSDLLEEQGPMQPQEIRRLLIETAKALGYAHKNGIVHRDIKPDNIMFDEAGNAVLTDFGIAKAATGTRLTGTGMSIGTPHYMSPEQARAQQLDGRSDIYSLGVVAYQCLTGHVPFDGEDAFSIGYKHIMEELPVPQLETAEQRRLFGVINRMMAKDPGERFQSAEELVANLEGGAPTGQAAAPPAAVPLSEAATTVIPTPPGGRPPTVPPGVRPSTPTTPMPKTEPPPARKKKRSGVLVGMLLVLFFGAGGAGGVWYFVWDLQWPLPFMQQGEMVADDSAQGAVPDDSAGPATGDSTPTQVAGDSAQTADSTGAAPLPETGVMVVTASQRLARIAIDGDRVTAGENVDVDPGSHRVTASLTGYRNAVETVQVGRGDTVAVNLQMARVQAEPDPEPPRPAGQCSNPENRDTYNLNDLCYETPPRPRDPPVVQVPPGVSGTPRQIVLWVKVGADGSGQEVRVVRSSTVPVVDVRASNYMLHQMRYEPATKGGRPVEAWVQLLVNPRR